MVNGTRFERAWQRVLVALFAAAMVLTPALAFAQGTGGGGGGGTGSGGTGSGAPGGAPSSGAPGGGTTGDGGGSGLAWIFVILAIAVAVWLFSRRRSGTVNR